MDFTDCMNMGCNLLCEPHWGCEPLGGFFSPSPLWFKASDFSSIWSLEGDISSLRLLWGVGLKSPCFIKVSLTRFLLGNTQHFVSWSPNQPGQLANALKAKANCECWVYLPLCFCHIDFGSVVLWYCINSSVFKKLKKKN